MSDDLAEFLDLDGYPITIKGKRYEVAQPDWPTVLLIQDVIAGKKTRLDGKPATDLWKLLLGPVWEEMLADKVPPVGMSRAGEAVVAWVTLGREAADVVFRSGISPEALAAAKTTAATQSAQGSTPSKSSDAANETPSRASSTGTRSRKTTPQPKSPQARKRPSV